MQQCSEIVFRKGLVMSTKILAALIGTAALGLTGLAIASQGSAQPYQGSTFNEVLRAIVERPEPRASDDDASDILADLELYGSRENPKLPQYPLSPMALVNGALKAAAVRTINDSSDTLPYFKKIVHSNGICLIGDWTITEPSIYTGYFAQGSSGYFIGRASTAGPATTTGNDRGFGLAGKIFPTQNPNERVKTANFFVVDNLNGTRAPHYTGVTMTNEPEFELNAPLKVLKFIFELADPAAMKRPLYPISRLDLEPGNVPRTPRWMAIRASDGTPRINEGDFRNELSQRNRPSGLSFDIMVSDRTKDTAQRAAWLKIGQINVRRQIVSFGCDRRLHFAHPKLVDPSAQLVPDDVQ